MKKCIYIGALHDILPLVTLPDVGHFVFMDSMPTSDGPNQPNLINLGNKIISTDYENNLDTFKIILEKNFEFAGYKLVDHLVDEQILSFANGSKRLDYIYGRFFPDDLNDNYKKLLSGANYLFVSGLFPSKEILNYCEKDFIFVGSRFTVYEYDETDCGIFDELALRDFHNFKLIFTTIDLKHYINYEFGYFPHDFKYDVLEFENIDDLDKYLIDMD